MEKQQKYILIAMVMLVFVNMFGILGEKASCATPEEIEQWLQAHNNYRALHGVPSVTWSDTVAASAQAWADTCPSGHSSSGYGENIAWASYALTPQSVVDLWYAEEQYYDYNNPGTSLDPNEPIGHFTQVVWKNTTQIGCGCKTGCASPYYCACVCQYNPPGNYIGQYAENVLPPTSTPVPGAPSLSSPANGATVSTTDITFSWTTPTGSPTAYHLQVSTSSTFSSTIYSNDSITGTSRTLSGFPNDGTTYYWRVRAYNSSGWGPWSSTRSFINGSTASVPGAPSLSSPANGATVSATSITFSWTTPTGSPTQYQLQVSTSSTVSSTVYDNASITDSSRTLSGCP
ncbi:MAG: CAP domain-containing protein, partial [Desulforhabdus sp.]|nr:CAP domain-containing protein [Desulforhabdus sp.]